MAKFSINRDLATPFAKEIEADSFHLKDGYFNFYDDENGQVAAVAAGQVVTIEQIE